MSCAVLEHNINQFDTGNKMSCYRH